jgi:hypothetical protein
MNIQGKGCAPPPPHILHNELQTKSDVPLIDVVATVNTILLYFHIQTLRKEELKQHCDFVDIKCKQILGCVKTMWLSFELAITRVTSMFPALRSYFLFQEKNPTMLKKIFNNPVSKFWINSFESQMKRCSISMKETQSYSISVSEVAGKLDIL